MAEDWPRVLALSRARTLLAAAGLDESFWCHASRHWAEGRLRRQLESMGWERRELVPFGHTVWAKRKLVTVTGGNTFRPPGREFEYLCPAVTMSFTTPGYFVQEIDSGKLFHTGDIVQVEEAPDRIELPAVEGGYLHEVEEREERAQPWKRPGRVRGGLKLLRASEESSTRALLRWKKLLGTLRPSFKPGWWDWWR